MSEKKQKQPLRDRLPPHSEEAEAGVLGCVLLNPVEALNECEEEGVALEWFYDLRHQAIWCAMDAMHKVGEGVDLITLHNALRKAGAVEDAGGMEYLTTLPDKTPAASNLSYWLKILWEKYLLRQLVQAGTKLAVTAMEADDKRDDADALLTTAEKDILTLAQQRSRAGERRIKDLMQQQLEELDDYHRGKPQMKGIGTGLDYLDKLLCGLGGKNGNYVVLSGRPGTGKTSLAMQIAEHAALDYVWFEPVLDDKGEPVMEEGKFKVRPRTGVPVGIFSLEMAAEALTHRMLFQRARADMQRWRTGFAETSEDVPRLVKAAGEYRLPDNIFIDDTSRCTIETLRAKARRMFRQHGIKLFVIDYIQLMRAGRRFRDDRVQELAEISGEIQSLGKELSVPFIVVAQMNRDYEKANTRAPRLSDLKDCGSIEQDADVVGFLYTPTMTADDKAKVKAVLEKVYGSDWAKLPVRQNLLIAKARYGPSGVVQLLFQRSCTRYADWIMWLKEHGEKEMAKGETSRGGSEGRGPMPTNEELGV